MNEIIKEFKHIARDMMLYILPGLVLIGYCFFLYFYVNDSVKWYEQIDYKSTILVIIASYIVGHIIMSFMEVLFVLTEVEKKIKNILFKKNQKR